MTARARTAAPVRRAAAGAATTTPAPPPLPVLLRGALTERLGLATQALRLALLTARQLAQPLQRAVDLRRCRLPLRVGALHLFVLVAQLVGLQPEQVGQLLGALAATTAATSAVLVEAHLHLAQGRLGALQLLQRALLGRQRLARRAPAEQLLGLPHRRRRERQRLGDLAQRRIRQLATALLHALRERLGLLAQSALGQRQRGQILAPLAGAAGSVSRDLERRGDDLALRSESALGDSPPPSPPPPPPCSA
jgi:hypothetical protein